MNTKGNPLWPFPKFPRFSPVSPTYFTTLFTTLFGVPFLAENGHTVRCPNTWEPVRGSHMSKLLLIAVVCLTPLSALAGEISDFDIGTYSLTGRDGQPSGMQMRLSKTNGKWVMEGKEKEALAPWKNISCDTGCEYRAATKAEHEAYLSSFPADMPRQFDIACIQNMANAFCRITKKDDPSIGGYALIALVTGKPVPMSMQRLTMPYPSNPAVER